MKQEKVKNSAAVKKTDNTEYMAMLLGALKQIGGDLRFLHNVLYDENGDEDERRKVEIALPYLEQKATSIEMLVAEFSKYIPDEVREKWMAESAVL